MSELLTREDLLKFLLSKAEPITESGCMIWTGVIHPDGYAMQWINNKNLRVHRTVFELVNGPIPKHLVTDHLCRVRCCINPYHIEAVTNKVNILRGNSPVGLNARKTHCNRGHLLSGDNLGTPCIGRIRVCRKCANINQANYEKRKKAISGSIKS